MNLSLLQLLGRCLTATIISVMACFNVNSYKENSISANNMLLEKDGAVVNSISYDTIIEYNSKIPSNITNVVQEGSIGLFYQEENSTKIVQDAIDEVIQKGTGAYGVYKGRLVGYGPDCKGCSGEGYLACKTEDGSRFSLKYDGIYYNDKEFGSIRILAANTKKFPCGTIIEVEKKDGTKFLAVVLDKISTVSANGELMDLAYSSQTDQTVFGADGLTGRDITFNVQRWGW